MSDTTGTEVARAPVAVQLDELNDLDQAWRMASALAQSDLVPGALRNRPANVLLVIMTGREIGLSAAQSIRTIYIPSGGQPQMRGNLLLARLRQAGHDYTYEENGDSCKFTVIRDNGREYTGSFTVDDAVAAGLAERKDGKIVARSANGRPLPWEQYRSDMLFWRAVARAVNRGAPEVVLGFDIAGTADPQPEVELHIPPAPSAGPAPTPPGAGPPPPSSPEAAGADVAAELAALNESSGPMLRRQQETVRPDEDPQGQHHDWTSGAGPGTSGVPPEQLPRPAPPPVKPPPGGGAPRARDLAALAERFKRLGWDPARYRDDVLKLCSAYARRRIKDAHDLSSEEVKALSSDLSDLYKDHDPEHYVVALADLGAALHNSWRDSDPEGYREALR
jgi:hypothetical protein